MSYIYICICKSCSSRVNETEKPFKDSLGYLSNPLNPCPHPPNPRFKDSPWNLNNLNLLQLIFTSKSLGSQQTCVKFLFQFRKKRKLDFINFFFVFFFYFYSILYPAFPPWFPASPPLFRHSHPDSPHVHSYSSHSQPHFPHSHPIPRIPTMISRILTLIPRIPTVIPRVTTMTPRVPTVIPRVPAVIPRVPMIPLIPFSDFPLQLLQIA